jgi:Ca2+/Na+ antiporter
MFVLVVGILLLIFFGKLHPKDIGSWKGDTGLGAVLLFVYAVIKVTLGNCAG